MTTVPAALNAWVGVADDAGTVFYAERRAEGVVVRQAPGYVVSYLRAADVTRDLSRSLRGSRAVASVAQEGDWVRVVWRSRRARDAACAAEGWFASQGIQTYEADVSPVQRWRVDTGVEVQKPRVVYLDIETDSRVPFSQKEEMRILCWALIDSDGAAVTGMLEQDTDAAERDSLVAFWRALDPYDQVVAWNGDGFDYPVLFARSAKRGVRVDARRWLWLDQMELYRRMNTAAQSGAEKQSMALHAVAMATLGEGKAEFDAAGTYAAWAAGGEEREALLAYNVRDTDLLRRIEQKTGFIGLLQTLCAASGVFPDTAGIKPMPQVETFVMRRARDRGIHYPTRHRKGWEGEESGDEGGFRGALVLAPSARGVVAQEVHVCDFASMYPSIVQSWNLSPETIREAPLPEVLPSYLRHLPAPKAPERPASCAVAPGTGVWVDQTTRGVLPEVLDTFIALRRQSSDLAATLPPGTPEWQAAQVTSTAYKVIANSVFGVVGAQLSRLYVREVAESITRTGGWLLQHVIDAAKARGYDVIYGDTDSAFVRGCSGEQFQAFVAWCNADLFPRLLAECGCVAERGRIRLAYEKAFERLVFVSAKRYIARWAHYKGTLPDERTKPEVKGLEYKRGDACRLAREMQAEIIDLLMGGGVLGPRRAECSDDPEEFESLVLRWRDRVLVAPLEVDDVLLAKRLTRPIGEYVVRKRRDGTDSAAPPHVRVAKLLRERGAAVGEGARVAYFVADGVEGVVLPVSDWTGECDRYAVWEDQVWLPAERLLAAAFPARDWTRHRAARPRRVRVAVTRAAKAVQDAVPSPQMGLFSLGGVTPGRPYGGG